MLENIDYKIYKAILEEDDILLLYTDGVTEAFNEKEEMYGENRLIEFLNKNKTEESIEDLISKLKTELKEFTNMLDQSDDITILTFTYKTKPQK